MRSHYQFEYETSVYSLKLGDLSFQIEALVDFEKTVDQIFEANAQNDGTELFSDYCPYFANLWASGRALAIALSSMGASAFSGKAAIELGCGLALPSFVISARGGKVLATDCHRDVPDFLNRNLQRNGLSSVTYRELDWRKLTDDAPGEFDLGKFDLILASDVLYDKEQPAKLLKQILTLAKPGSQVFIADPGRAYLQEFHSLLEAQGLRFKTDCLVAPEFRDQKAVDIYLIEIQF